MLSSNANETLNAGAFNLNANNDSANDNVNIGSTLTCLENVYFVHDHQIVNTPCPLGKTNKYTSYMLVGRKMRRRRGKTRLIKRV